MNPRRAKKGKKHCEIGGQNHFFMPQLNGNADKSAEKRAIHE